MKNHLKRIAAPKTWVLDRKKNTFITRPDCGAHSLDLGLSLGVIIRDILKMSSTIGEAQKIINNKEVLVDGKRRKNRRFIVGLFDVLSFPQLKKYYRLVLDNKGRIAVIEIDEKESSIKPARVIGKTVLQKGKIQYNLYDGKNIISDQKAKVGDVFVLNLPNHEVKKVLPLKEGSVVFLTKGKQSGNVGILKEIKGNEVLYSFEGKEIATAKKYIFVIGEKEAVINVNGVNGIK